MKESVKALCPAYHQSFQDGEGVTRLTNLVREFRCEEGVVPNPCQELLLCQMGSQTHCVQYGGSMQGV